MHNKKTVFITGASSGIGQASVLKFVQADFNVAGTARRSERLHQLQTEIDGLSGEHGIFLPITADVRDPDALQLAIDQTVEHFGKIDVLIANAGVGFRSNFADADWADIETLLQTNINGVLHTIRAAVPTMRQNPTRSQIVIISSVTYNMVSPYTSVYAASKAFVSSMAASLRQELEPDNIFVTDMLIGRTESEFNEKRLGKPGRSGGGIPVMPVEKVAQGILRVVQKPRARVTLRWFDRFLVLGNLIVPGLIGRMASRQYR